MANPVEIADLSQTDLEDSFRKYFEDESLKVEQVMATISPKKGGNFMSKVEYMQVTFESGPTSGRKKETLPVFVKKGFLSGDYAELIKKSLLYEKEAAFFNVFLPLLRASCAKYEGDLDLDFLPVCYHASPEIVVLENLVVSKGYQMYPRSGSGQGLTHVKQVMEALSKLHAASFVVKKQWDNPSKVMLNRYPVLKDTMGTKDEPGLGFFQQTLFEVIDKFLEETGGYPKALEILRRIQPKILDVYAEMVTPEEPFNVICHGDCWSNNTMFLYSESGDGCKLPVMATLVDFQATRWASLTTDLLYFLYTSTSLQFRKEHLHVVLHHYFGSLNKCLAKNGQIGLTLEEFQGDFFRRRLFGLVCGLPMLVGNLIPAENSADVSDLNFNPTDSEAVQEYFLVELKSAARQDRSIATILSDFIEDFKDEVLAYTQCEEDPLPKMVLEDSLKRHFQDPALQVKSVNVTTPSWQGMNFTSRVEHWDITLQRSNCTTSLLMFVKKTMTGSYSELFKICLIYKKEAAFFNQIVPLLAKTGIKMDFAPVCYFASEQAIALENLVTEKGYQISPSTLNLSHVQAVLDVMAAMHAASFGLKRQWEIPDLMATKEFPILVNTRMGFDGKSGFSYYNITCVRVIGELLEKGGRHPNALHILRRIELHQLEIYAEMIRAKEPFGVVCHGDAGKNNVMFQYSPDDQDRINPKKAMLIDFQAMQWGHLISDILYFLYTSTSLQFLHDHTEMLLCHYHACLSQHLESAGIPSPGFSVKELSSEFNNRRLFGLLWGLPMLASNLIPREKIPASAFQTFNPETFEEMVDQFMHFLKITADSTMISSIAEFLEDFGPDIDKYLLK